MTKPRNIREGGCARLEAKTRNVETEEPSSLKISPIMEPLAQSFSPMRIAPTHCRTVLTIANRLSADQALGDMVERVARVGGSHRRRAEVMALVYHRYRYAEARQHLYGHGNWGEPEMCTTNGQP